MRGRLDSMPTYYSNFWKALSPEGPALSGRRRAADGDGRRGRRRRAAGHGRGRLRRGLVQRRRIALATVAGSSPVGRRSARGLAGGGRAARARHRGALARRAVVEALAGAVVEATAAAARVLAEERPRHERVLGLLEPAAELAAGLLHVLAPELRRDRAARDPGHRHARLRVAEPHGGRQVRREADEPRVGEVVGGAGLAGGRAADLRRVREAGAALDVLLEDLRRLGGDAVGERAVLARLAEVVDVAVGERDLPDRDRAVAPAAGGDRRVGVGHLERGDAARQAAKALGRVGVQAGLDAHVVRGPAHRVGADVGVELGVDRVVGLQGRLDEVDAPRVRVAVGVHRVVRRGRQPAGPERTRLVGRRLRVHAAAQRCHQDHDLERRPRLPVTLGGEVELRVAVARRRRHRLDVAGPRVDRHDRGRAVGRAQVAVHRLALQVLEGEVDRGVDPQAAAAHVVEPVLVDELLLDEIEEVALTARRVVVVAPDAEAHPLRAVGRDLLDIALVGHPLQDVVPAGLGGARVEERVVLRRRLGQAGEQRRLAELELACGLVEEQARAGLDAHGGLAADGPERYAVQVLREDPELALEPRVQVLEVLGELRLADLALERALLLARVEVADELHRERRAALDLVAVLEVLHARADDALEVDTLVLEEAAVLDGDDGVLDVLRDLLRRDGRAQLVGLDEAEARAVGGVDARRRAELDGLARVQRRRGVRDADDPSDDASAGDQADGDEQSEREQDGPPRACLVAALPALSLASSHSRGVRLEKGSPRRVEPLYRTTPFRRARCRPR